MKVKPYLSDKKVSYRKEYSKFDSIFSLNFTPKCYFLFVRGYNVFSGYVNEPEKTAEALETTGWYHTGDQAIMDEEGYISIA